MLCTSPRELTAVHVVRGLFDSIGLLLGSAIAGVLFTHTGVATVFFVAAGIYAVGTWLTISIRGVTESIHRMSHKVLAQFAEGVRAVVGHSGVHLLVGLTFLQTLVYGGFAVFLVAIAQDLLHTGDSAIGWLNSALGFGGLLGGFFAAALVGSRRLALWLASAWRGLGHLSSSSGYCRPMFQHSFCLRSQVLAVR